MPEGGLDLTAVAGGTRLRLRVRPGSRSSAIVGLHGGALKIAVSAPPERGKANEAVAALLAEALGLPRASVAVVSGAASQDKVVVLALPVGEAKKRLDGLIAARG